MSVETIIRQKEKGSLVKLSDRFEHAGDKSTAKKMMELDQKASSGEFVLAFCGHFSAGKSTMINTLMGKEILPSSPIPTSANVVKIKTGEAKAVAFFKNQAPVEFNYLEELEKLKDFCKDGDEVTTVEISCPNDFLVNNACLLDTPGIDSTDAAHKVATESALHLADVVVYMMDYNHVQSEINFQFTKMLKERGKKLFLVINQIDKHFDLELDFYSFKQSVEEAFKQWGVLPDAIFYTTLKVPHHPENQFEQLHDELYHLFWEKEEVLKESIQHAAKDLLEEHEKYIKSKNHEQRERLEQRIKEPAAEIEAKYKEWASRLHELEQKPSHFKSTVVKEIQGIIENANVTPFAIRELAKLFLESCQSGFRVGFLFSAGKTKQEKENRFKNLQHAFEVQLQANLSWHLQDLFRGLAKRFSLTISQESIEMIDQIQVPITEELLQTHVKSGARLTGDSVLNYCKDLSNDVKGKFRRICLDILETIFDEYNHEVMEIVNVVKKEGAELETMVQSVHSLQKLDAEEAHYMHELDAILEEGEDKLVSLPSIENGKEKKRSTQQKNQSTFVKKEEIKTLVLENTFDQTSPFKVDYKAQLQATAADLLTTAEVIETLPGQTLAVKNLRQRAERLRTNLFTVALFGAFSAGKSSFANAMMGEMLLPVSPNPTTATINKILPPTDEFTHGTVRVKIKSREDMIKDVLQSLSVFRLEASTMEEALELIHKINVDEILPSSKPHLSFLLAVKRGLDEMGSKFGEIQLVDLDEFKVLVAKEEKACFVEWIELYYSCPLTEQGISLVDTPGADSINARHTGVAFDYIKNADAVLFVTYYNHAFSHADREFLQQLGRVKDAFEMDKMFFLVNAADLARSKEELLNVVEHVKDNLTSCGIRKPRIYPVSSQTALLARMLAKGGLTPSAEQVYRERTGSNEQLMSPLDALAFSGFQSFETDFIRFTVEELTQVAITSAVGEIKRARENVQDYLQSVQQGEDQRIQRLGKLEESWKIDQTYLEQNVGWNKEKDYISKETQELLYYVDQRLFFKLNDLFKLSFNPSVLKDEPGKPAKRMVEQCFDEFMRHVSFSLEQEIRATTLRTENYVNQLSKGLLTEVQDVLKGPIQLEFTPTRLAVPEFTTSLSYQAGETKSILSLFKSPKHFFEQGGNDLFKSKLEEWLKKPVTDYLEACSEQLQSFYFDAFEKINLEWKEQIKNETNEYYQGMISALKDGYNVVALENAYTRLNDIIAANEEDR